MANYNENQITVILKGYSRLANLPLDLSSVWDTKTAADTYANSNPTAYGGQIITALVDGKYKAYILQSSEAGYTLEPLEAESGSSAGSKEYVVIGTRPENGQEQGVIYIENNIGYIWTGSEWKKIFEDVSTSITDFEERIGQLETDITTKANIANPEFTGTVKVNGEEVATKEYADSIVAAAQKDVPSIVDEEHSFPETNYRAGEKYVITEAGEYFGQDCEPGDVILIVKDYAEGTAADTDAVILQSNIDGAVTGPDSAVDGEIVVFSGITGKVIKSSKINMSALSDAIAKVHEHANKTQLDTYDKTQTELLAAASEDAQDKVDALNESLTEALNNKADKATTLAGYGITDAYTKTEIDEKVQTINNNLNSKVDGETVDNKIIVAKTEITSAYQTAIEAALDERIGEFPEDTSLKDYIDTAIGTGGGTDFAEAIAEAKQDAIDTAKAYTDAAMTIVEF